METNAFTKFKKLTLQLRLDTLFSWLLFIFQPRGVQHTILLCTSQDAPTLHECCQYTRVDNTIYLRAELSCAVSQLLSQAKGSNWAAFLSTSLTFWWWHLFSIKSEENRTVPRLKRFIDLIYDRRGFAIYLRHRCHGTPEDCYAPFLLQKTPKKAEW